MSGALLLTYSLLAAAPVHAQVGHIRGVVTDNMGGILPGVSVTARAFGTGPAHVTVTGADGTYQSALPAFLAVPYAVSFELEGYQTVRKAVFLGANQTLDLDAQLAPGSGWSAASPHPRTLSQGACVTDGGYVYCAGGRRQVAEGVFTFDQSSYAPFVPAGGIYPWQETTKYAAGAGVLEVSDIAGGFDVAESIKITDHACVAHNGYIYCVGGWILDIESQPTNLVLFAPLSSSGIGEWQQTTSYEVPEGIQRTEGLARVFDGKNVVDTSCVVDNGRIYCVGGRNAWKFPAELTGVDTRVPFPSDLVLYADLTPAGVGPWRFANHYGGGGAAGHRCVAYGGYIYCVGGQLNKSWFNILNPFANELSDEVWFAQLLPSGGVGPWVQTTPYGGGAVDFHSCTVDAGVGHIVCVGGGHNQAWSAKLSGDGVGQWIRLPDLPADGGRTGWEYGACLADRGRVYCIGGHDAGTQALDHNLSDDVYFLPYSSTELKDGFSCFKLAGEWNAATLTCTAQWPLTIEGQLEIKAGVTLAGKAITNRGTIINSGTLAHLGGTIINSGTLAHVVTNEPGAKIVNHGSIVISSVLPFLNKGDIVNEGTLAIAVEFSNEPTGRIFNNGSITNDGTFANFGFIANGSVGTIRNGQGGTFVNAGLIFSDVSEVTNFGTIFNFLNGNTCQGEGNALISTDSPFFVFGVWNPSTGTCTAGFPADSSIAETITIRPGFVLMIDSGVTLITQGVLDVYGRIENRGGVITNQGMFRNGRHRIHSGTMRVHGTIASSGTIINENSGTVVIDRGGEISSTGTFNQWRGLNDGFATSRVFILSGARLLNAGTMHIGAGTWIHLFGQLANTGTIRNEGTIATDGIGAIVNENGGFILNENGGVVDEGQVGVGPSPVTMVLDSVACESLGGAWTTSTMTCVTGMGAITIDQATTLQIDSGVTLENRSSLFTVRADGIVLNAGAIVNNGGLAIEGILIVDGQGVIHNAGDLGSSNTASVINAGTIINRGTAILRQGHNPGTIRNECGGDFSASPTFMGNPAVQAPCTTDPGSVAVGDFNGDGLPDVALANYVSDTVSVLLGSGEGAFNPPTSYLVGSGPHAVAVGDFDGNGWADLAVANRNSASVSVLLGRGDGTFHAAVSYAAAQLPISLAIADFDADGHADLAVANRGLPLVGVLRGWGDGTFGPVVSYLAGTGPRSLAAGDFNHDGRIDLAVATDVSRTVNVLLGNGDATFQAPVSYGAGILERATALALSDANGDGHLDVAVLHSNFADITRIEILLGTGAGSFQVAGGYDVGLGSIAVAVADVNGDGRADVAVANREGTNVSVLRGNGDGTFQPAANHVLGAHPNSIATGDFNADGAADLVTANSGGEGAFSILFGTHTRPDLTITKTHAGDFRQGQSEASYVITVTNSGLGPTTATVAVTDLLPIKLTAVQMSGPGWSCTPGTLTCNRSDVLAAGASYPPILLTVDVAADAPPNITNIATVSGGGESKTTNNSAANETTILEKPTLTVVAADATRTYGHANPVFAGSIVGLQNNDTITATYASAATPGDPVGTYDIVPTLVDPDGKLGNYTVVLNNGTLTVSPALLTVTADAAAKTYGEPMPAFTASYAGFVAGDGPASLGGALDFALPPSAHDVGTYTVTPFGLTSSNYAIAFVPGSFTIQQAPLRLVAQDARRSYWDPDPVLTGAASGIVSGDMITATFSTTTTAATPAGIYAGAIVPSLLDPGNRLPNYIVTSVSGTFTIVNPLPVLDRLGVNSIVKADSEAANPYLLEIHGSDFVPQSTVRWNGEVLQTMYVTPKFVIAAVPSDRLDESGVAYVTVFNPTDAGGGGESALKEFFITDNSAPIADAATSTVDGGTLMVTAGGTGPFTPGSLTVEGTATGWARATVAHYTDNPGGPATFKSGGQYLDVFVAPGSQFSTLTITNCAPGPEHVNRVYFFNGANWEPASHQSFNPTSNCVTVTVTDEAPPNETSPTLAQLVGTYFATGIDFTPPSTTASAAPAYTFGKWTNQPVTVTLTAQDESDGSGVAHLAYSVAGAGAMPTEPSPAGVATFQVTAEGDTTITFSATDRAGNAEEPQTTHVLIDRTAPAVTASADRSNLWPPNGKLVPVTISGTITDDGSGFGSAAYRVSDSEGEEESGGGVVVDADGRYSFTLMLPARRSGQGKEERQFLVNILATDAAGNGCATSVRVIVPHDQGR